MHDLIYQGGTLVITDPDGTNRDVVVKTAQIVDGGALLYNTGSESVVIPSGAYLAARVRKAGRDVPATVDAPRQTRGGGRGGAR